MLRLPKGLLHSYLVHLRKLSLGWNFFDGLGLLAGPDVLVLVQLADPGVLVLWPLVGPGSWPWLRSWCSMV